MPARSVTVKAGFVRRLTQISADWMAVTGRRRGARPLARASKEKKSAEICEIGG